MDKNIEVLEEVLNLLDEEKKKFYDKINENDFKIEEINSYLRELSRNEDDDFKAFSPRNSENRHHDRIEADTAEKENCEKKNAEYQKKIEFLKNLMDKVNAVIETMQIEEKNIEQYSDIENLEQDHIANQILNCVSYIVPDAERAKIELTAIAEKMKKRG